MEYEDENELHRKCMTGQKDDIATISKIVTIFRSSGTKSTTDSISSDALTSLDNLLLDNEPVWGLSTNERDLVLAMQNIVQSSTKS